jgi:hypothetical protein
MSATRKSSQPELSPRGADTKAQRAAIEQQASRYASLAQQPLHAALSRGLKLTVTAHNTVEVLAGFENPHEELPT